MTNINTVHLTGTVQTNPRMRELPSGNAIWAFELNTGRASIPIVYDGPLVPSAKDTEVDIHGEIVSRFFRVGGATQRRVEVLATSVRRLEP
jgi:hypothetical protein